MPEQTRRIQLYDVYRDPAESNNRANKEQEKVEEMKNRILHLYRTEMVEADYPRGLYVMYHLYTQWRGQNWSFWPSEEIEVG